MTRQQLEDINVQGKLKSISFSRFLTTVQAQNYARLLFLTITQGLLLRMTRQRLEDMDVQGSANTLYVLAVLRHPDKALVTDLMAVSAKRNSGLLDWSQG